MKRASDSKNAIALLKQMTEALLRSHALYESDFCWLYVPVSRGT